MKRSLLVGFVCLALGVPQGSYAQDEKTQQSELFKMAKERVGDRDGFFYTVRNVFEGRDALVARYDVIVLSVDDYYRRTRYGMYDLMLVFDGRWRAGLFETARLRPAIQRAKTIDELLGLADKWVVLDQVLAERAVSVLGTAAFEAAYSPFGGPASQTDIGITLKVKVGEFLSAFAYNPDDKTVKKVAAIGSELRVAIGKAEPWKR